MVADLHLHTFFSDGTYSPEELVLHGRRHGLQALSLTDHDSTAGCARMAAACAQADITFVSGAELTSTWSERELHILGYGLDIHSPTLLAALTRQQQARTERIHEIVARLNVLGVPITVEAVLQKSQGPSPGRPHVARVLVEAGICPSMDEAFDRFLKKGRPAYVPRLHSPAPDTIALIHRSGGLASLAHPGLSRAEEWIPTMVEAGLDGLECFHPTHAPAATEHFLALARRHHLLITGGSDCHGMNKGVPLIGTVKLPDEHFAALQAALASRRLTPSGTT